MCPHECPGLSDSHSEEFETRYLKYEKKEREEKLKHKICGLKY